MVEHLLHRALDVDLVDEVDAAAQVETELQRIESEVAHPLGDARGLRKRDRELVGPRLGDDIPRLQLILFAGEAQGQPALVEKGAARRDPLVLQQLFDGGAVCRRHDRPIAGELQRALFAE